MKVDESGAPWPYPDVDEPDDPNPGVPTWECPGGICQCHSLRGDAKRNDHRVHFFDHEVKRMPGARCRVFEDGQLVNKESPYADGSGAISVKIRPGTRSLRLEWAPADLPEGPRYPFRRIYHVTLEPGGERGVQQRLENIGFFAYNTIEDNVRDFQREYILAVHQSGEPGHIHPTLRKFHDLATLPPLGTKVPAEPAGEGDTLKAKVGDGSKDGDKPPAQAPQGCAAASLRPVVKLRIVRAFSIQKGTLHAPNKTTPEALSDPDQILDELYGKNVVYRFPRSDDQAVKKANVTYFIDGAKKGTTQADDHGVASVPLTGATAGSKLKLVVLPPDENDLSATRTTATKKKLQLNRTNKPAGPMMTDKGTSLAVMYRPFVLEVDLDDKGLVPLDASCLPDRSKIRVSPAMAPAPDDTTGDVNPDAVKAVAPVTPAYVKLIDATITKPRTGDVPELVIDWRCDWMKGPTHDRYAAWNAFTKSKSTTPGATPQAPPALPATAPPPCLTLHQTHSPFVWTGVISGFLIGHDTSIHYVVDLDGHVVKLCDEYYLAWHAGDSQWGNHNAVNQFSVGIEHVHSDVTPPGANRPTPYTYTPRDFPQEQCDAIVRLCKEIVDTYQIAPRHVIGHRDVNLLGGRRGDYPALTYGSRVTGGKPDCPGICFPWEALEEAGIATPPSTGPGTPFVGEGGDDDQTKAINLYMNPPAALNQPNNVGTPLPLKTTGLTAQQTADILKLLKQMLFDVGYSVDQHDPAPSRSALVGALDGGLLGAVGAFQTHHFSRSRRAYRHDAMSIDKAKRTASLDAKPRIGHVDADTIRAVIEAWWARDQAP